jgi:maltooligosyltrehalose trehalohydrolase
MPFGAECRDDGTVRFRLWAPAAQQVELRLTNTSKDLTLPLRRKDEGWFELVTDAATAGSRYLFRIDGAQEVADPASRFQPQDVHGPSEVINANAFDWEDGGWRGRRWEEAVIYELHVGAFSRAGTFSGVSERLDYLAELGITVLEVMPVADFPGQRNWGYDGVLPFAPDSTYGRPENLKAFVQHAHAHGMMVLLDVVYNHFGPDGNFLNLYAPQFFTDRHCTPWGNGLNFDGVASRAVRDFFIHNALYWLLEYHFDGLRLDAVHAIVDDSQPDILTELAESVRSAVPADRRVHLVLENERNQASYLQRTKDCRPRMYTAQWNDDIHHALHVVTTGEKDGYYFDYSERPLAQLGRCLTEGFAYQGDPSRYKGGEPRGEPSSGLPPTAFIGFLQNHDQIGNRAFGERITKLAEPLAVRAAMAILLLAPTPPMLFMGDEFGAETPFLFFCDFKQELATAVTNGRRNEFARFGRFNDPAERERIPDPNAPATFEASRLDWSAITQPSHREWLKFYRRLLELRCRYILSLSGCHPRTAYEVHGDQGLTAYWTFSHGNRLLLLANLGASPLPGLPVPTAKIIYSSEHVDANNLKQGILPAWSVIWALES